MIKSKFKIGDIVQRLPEYQNYGGYKYKDKKLKIKNIKLDVATKSFRLCLELDNFNDGWEEHRFKVVPTKSHLPKWW